MAQKQVSLHELTTIPNAPVYQAYKNDSLFEHATWVYAFCREHLFRDDTRRIITALWPEGPPASGTTLIELGCGPGFYSCRLGERFREMLVTGADRSANLLTNLCRARA